MSTQTTDLTPELLEMQRWVAERLERANEAISNRATTLIGFLGIEITIFAVISPKNYKNPNLVESIGALAAVSFLGTIIQLLFILLPKDFYFPPWTELSNAFQVESKLQREVLIKILTLPEDEEKSFFRNLELENEKLYRPFKRAIYLTFVSQLMIIGLLAIMWGNARR